mgnify:CR=1 FL=1
MRTLTYAKQILKGQLQRVGFKPREYQSFIVSERSNNIVQLHLVSANKETGIVFSVVDFENPFVLKNVHDKMALAKIENKLIANHYMTDIDFSVYDIQKIKSGLGGISLERKGA